MPNTRLCCQVDDVSRLDVGKERGDRGLVGDVGRDETEVVAPKAVQSGQLQLGVVVGIEVVESDHVLVAPQQLLSDLRSDETGNTCNQPFRHASPVRIDRRGGVSSD